MQLLCHVCLLLSLLQASFAFDKGNDLNSTSTYEGFDVANGVNENIDDHDVIKRQASETDGSGDEAEAYERKEEDNSEAKGAPRDETLADQNNNNEGETDGASEPPSKAETDEQGKHQTEEETVTDQDNNNEGETGGASDPASKVEQDKNQTEEETSANQNNNNEGETDSATEPPLKIEADVYGINQTEEDHNSNKGETDSASEPPSNTETDEQDKNRTEGESSADQNSNNEGETDSAFKPPSNIDTEIQNENATEDKISADQNSNNESETDGASEPPSQIKTDVQNKNSTEEEEPIIPENGIGDTADSVNETAIDKEASGNNETVNETIETPAATEEKPAQTNGTEHEHIHNGTDTKPKGRNVLNTKTENTKVDESEKIQESSGDTKHAGGKDTTILIVLFVAVVIVGALAFGYNFVKKRRQNNSQDSADIEAVPGRNNQNSIQHVPEARPLMADNKDVELKEMKRHADSTTESVVKT